MPRFDTWTRVLRAAVRWFCQYCGQVNPEITAKCLGCGQ